MENRLKLRISRLFRSSFGSCRSRNISESDVVAKLTHKNSNSHMKMMMMTEPLLSPKARPFPSICRPKCPEITTTHPQMMIFNNTCCIDTAPRSKVSEQYSPFALTTTTSNSSDNHNGHAMCPPASPTSPFNDNTLFYYGCNKEKKKHHSHSEKNRKKKRTHSRKTNRRSDSACIFSSSSQESFRGWSWFSSDEDDNEKEDETETLFSSKTLSSDSSGSSLHRRHRSLRKKDGTRRRRAAARKLGPDVLPLPGGKVKDSFAVVKSSSDPYNDFRTSMVEMIVEKQIFAAKDLEQLLQCFLSLNSHHHHRIILEVFTEIWEALFSDWS